MWPRILSVFAVFILGLSTATSSSDRQSSPEPVTKNEAAATTQHQEASYRTCHWQAGSVGSSDHAVVSDENQCLSCHIDATADHGRLSGYFHGQSDKACTQCHSFHDTSRLIAGDRRFASPAGEGVRYQCRSCHNPAGSLTNLSEAHLVAAVEFYHAENTVRGDQSPSQSCLECHSDGAHAVARYDGGRLAIAINSFASHPNECEIITGQNRSFNSFIDARIHFF